MGDELVSSAGLFDSATGNWDYGEDNRPIAGEYIVTHVDLQGVSSAQLVSHMVQIDAIKAKFDQYQAMQNDPAIIAGLTKEDIFWELFYSGILSYFAKVNISDQIAAYSRKDIVTYRLPSFGAFRFAAKPQYWFGIARNVSFPSVVMDVDRLHYQVVAKNMDQAAASIYMRQVGVVDSAFEHAVPERIMSDITKPRNDPTQLQGASAAKAIEVAMKQGQKIYTLNTTNQTSHAALLSQVKLAPLAMTEVQNALAIGKEVTVHQAPITLSGWTGSGYIIVDPTTGAGAYKISGGANGAALGDAIGGIFQGISAAALAVSDNLVSNRLDMRVFFSDALKYQKNLARASALVGWAGIGIQVLQISNNGSLNNTQMLGQISINVLAYALTAYLIGQMVALGLIGGAPILLMALLIGFTLTLASTLIIDYYFSRRERWMRYA